MTMGTNLKSKSANPQGAQCQKCLERGHWTYECKGKRKIVVRESRMTIFNKRLKQTEEKQHAQTSLEARESSKQKIKQKKKKKPESSSDSSSNSSSSDSSTSSESSSSDSSDESSSMSSDSSD